MNLYQPTWNEGREVGIPQRDATGRYRAIADYLSEYPFLSEFGVLDFGAYNGYFCRRLADDFDALCVAVDDYGELEPYPGVAVIKKRLTAEDLLVLGSWEVVLCLSVLHHLEGWRDYLDVLCSIGTVVFIEVADPLEELQEAVAHSDSQLISDSIVTIGGMILTWTPGYDSRCMRPLWVVDRRKGN